MHFGLYLDFVTVMQNYFKDTHGKNMILNKIQALTKSSNIDVWLVGT